MQRFKRLHANSSRQIKRTERMIAEFPSGKPKMNAIIHRWVCASLLIWTASTAHANCGVIDTLDKLHAVEVRLMRNPNSPLFTSEIRYLTHQARQLSGESITEGLGASPVTDKGATFLYFVYYAKKIALEVSVDEPATALRHLLNPTVSENIASVGTYLGDMRCSETEIAEAEVFLIVASDQIDIDFLVARSVITSALGIRSILVVLGIAVALLIWSQLRPTNVSKITRTKDP
jgi:hypothetical protein